MIFLSRKSYKMRLHVAQQEAMTDLLYELCNSGLVVHDQNRSLDTLQPYTVDQNNRGMLRRFACMATDRQVYRPWWHLFRINQ